MQRSWELDWPELLAKDGISAYSTSYWEAFRLGKGIEAKSAINETLAEIARINWETGKLTCAMVWKEFYCAVNNAYSRILEDRERKAKARNVADNALLHDLERQWVKDDLKEHDNP